jgi:cation transport ATPase
VYDEEEVRRMTPLERQRLRLILADIDAQDLAGRARDRRRRALILGVIIVCCMALAAWTGLLAATLPRYYRSGGWRGAWVGFDIALLAAFAVTGWASWRRRQILIVCLVVVATLLCCDAWFDVVLDAHTSGFWLSLLSALVIELPLAAVAILGARRLIRMTNAVMLRYRGVNGPVPRLRDIPLAGVEPGRPLTDLLVEPEAHLPAARDNQLRV